MISRFGIPRTPYRAGVSGLSSTLILTTFNLPAYWVASSSTSGAIALHGPHHGAQKSIRTGCSDFNTSCSKFLSVTCETPAFAIELDSFASILRSEVKHAQPRFQADTRKQSFATRVALPITDSADIHVHEIGARIVADSSPAKRDRCTMQRREIAAGYRDVGGHRVDMQAVARDPVAARMQHRVGLRRAVSGN